MTYQTTDTGLLRWLLGAGALAAAILLVGLGLSASTVQAQATLIYSGSIDVVDANCGGGVIEINQSADGMSVVLVSLDQTKADGSPITGIAVFDPGALPIGSDGSFSTTFNASDVPTPVPTPDGVTPPAGGAGHRITIAGTFTDDTLTGTMNVSPSSCGNVPFSAHTAPEPQPAPAGALVFHGHFEPIFDFFLPQPDGGRVPLRCGGGDITIIVTPDRKEIFSFELIGNTVAGVSVSAAFHSQPGQFPVDQNGNVSGVTVTGVFSTTTQATFDFDADPQTVAATLTTFQTADHSVVYCEQHYTATRDVEAALPSTGTGPASASGDGMTLWALLAASLGALTLATGLALGARSVAQGK